MSELFLFLPADGGPRFLWDCLWQTTLVGLAVLVLVRLCFRQPARRAWLLFVGMLSCALLPLASAAARRADLGVFTPSDASRTAVATTVPDLPVSERTVTPVDQTAQLAAPPHASRAATVDAWALFALAWAGMTLFFAGRLALSVWGTRQIFHRAEGCANQRILADAKRATSVIGMAREPIVAVSEDIATPVVLAFRVPRLLIPQTALEDNDVDWFAVFSHELAHVRRGDGWFHLAAELITVLLPWQPFVWQLKRALYFECEQACDDWAVAAGVDPVDFAAMLTRWIPSKPALLAPSMASSSAARRVLRLLALRQPAEPRPKTRWQLGTALAALVVASGVAFAQVRKGKSPEPARMSSPPTPARASSPHSAQKPAHYVIGPPDILTIDALKVVPKPPYHIEPLDRLEIAAVGTLVEHELNKPFRVDSSGTVNLGPVYGKVRVAGLTADEASESIDKQLRKTLVEPQVSVTLLETSGQQEIAGEHLVGPDGTVNLGIYGTVYLAGMTIDQAKKAIEDQLSKILLEPRVAISVFAYNSKVIYLIVKRDTGDSITRLPWTGRENALFVIAGEKLVITPQTKIWIYRAGPDGHYEKIDVDWAKLIQGAGASDTNQLQPSDRLFVANAEIEKSTEREDRNPATLRRAARTRP